VLEARVVQARVPQFEIPTLSVVAAACHGRLLQKDDAASSYPHKWQGRAHAKAERRYRQPLCAGIHIAAPFAALALGDSASRTPR
jgi:hypothetical protein